MPKVSTKWSELFLAFDQIRHQSRMLQKQEDRKSTYGLLLFLLAACVLGSLCLLLRHTF